MSNKFYTADGTEYTRIFENETVVLGRDRAGNYKVIRRENISEDRPSEKSEQPETTKV